MDPREQLEAAIGPPTWIRRLGYVVGWLLIVLSLAFALLSAIAIWRVATFVLMFVLSPFHDFTVGKSYEFGMTVLVISMIVSLKVTQMLLNRSGKVILGHLEESGSLRTAVGQFILGLYHVDSRWYRRC